MTGASVLDLPEPILVYSLTIKMQPDMLWCQSYVYFIVVVVGVFLCLLVLSTLQGV